MGYYKYDRATGEKTKSYIACLASIPLDEVTLCNMAEYTQGSPCSLEVAGTVMDMMERDLGVQFTEQERQGMVELGSNPPSPRYLWHMVIAPFRVFAENGVRAEATFQRLHTTPENGWGAYITTHLMGKPKVGSWTFMSQNHTWFDNLGYGGSISLPTVLCRTMLLFPTLHDKIKGSHRTEDKGYIMATGLRPETEAEWADRLQAIFGNRTSLLLTDHGKDQDKWVEQAHDCTAKFQLLFNEVQKAAREAAVEPAVKPLNFKLAVALENQNDQA